MIKRTLLLSTALAALASATHAVTTEVIITVTRQPLPVSKVGQAVAVLDDKDIETYQSVYLADLMTHTPSLTLTRNGGPGSAASASIRGAGADHTLYLLDGIRLNDPSQVGGGTNLGLVATDDAARIEVLRGPLSTLWGSGALGGVISITSRESQAPLEATVAVEGYDDYGSVRAAVGGKTGRLTWRLFGNAVTDDGISTFAGGSEADAFTQTNLAAKGSLAVTDNVTVRAFSTYSRSRNDYDGYPAPLYAFADTDEFGRTATRLSAVALEHRFAKGEQVLSLSESQANRHDYFNDGSQFIARGGIQSADYHLLYRLSDATRLLGGVAYERDTMRIASPASWDPNPTPLSVSVTTSSVYGQITQNVGPATIAVSARHDDSSSFGALDIVQASVAAPVGPFRLHASAGTGIKAPSLYQLYSDYGHAGLVPENGVTIDAGADYITANGRIGITVFTRTVRDLIAFQYDNCTPTQVYGCYGSIDRSRASGVELTGAYGIGAWTIRGDYSFLNTRNESANLPGKALAHAPEQSGGVDIDYRATERLSLGVGLRHVGDSFDNAANTRLLKAYDLVDLRASYTVNDRLRLYGRIENAGDSRYETASFYGQPGRRVWLGVNARVF
ncbi:vitamin B12 transporter btuB [Asticcacaulis biprosthecium C19]|uniref:Vitamin B12 transporter btuB n=1 Tax=Asticcacaulis biprosthecium C19 TaxID=715226 RepID=F4QL25_9CAUL|nr:TonB-dependent receptor [Asticcacaulis biprosthecium]EGF93400.1 vitamin B12 transporter btuB [Asticcacaulis biprosthecium C19]